MLYGLRARYSRTCRIRDHVVGRRDEAVERPRHRRVEAERTERLHRGHAWTLMIDTLEAAAAWVDEVGLALLFPKADVVLPSLWEQVAGDRRGAPCRPRARRDVRALGGRDGGSSGARRTSCRPAVSSASASTSPASRPASRPASCRHSSLSSTVPSRPVSRSELVSAIRANGPLTGTELRDARRCAEARGRPRHRRPSPAARPHELASGRAGSRLGRGRARSPRPQVAAPGAAAAVGRGAPRARQARPRNRGRADRSRPRRRARLAAAAGRRGARRGRSRHEMTAEFRIWAAP